MEAASAAERRKPPKAAQRKRPSDQPSAAESEGRGRRRSRRAPTGARATGGGRREAAGDPGCGSEGRRTSDRLTKTEAGLRAKPAAGLEAKARRERAAPPACRPPAARTTSRRRATDPPTGGFVPRGTLYRIPCCRGMFYNIKSKKSDTHFWGLEFQNSKRGVTCYPIVSYEGLVWKNGTRVTTRVCRKGHERGGFAT